MINEMKSYIYIYWVLLSAYTLLYLVLVSVKKIDPLVWMSRSFAKRIGFP